MRPGVLLFVYGTLLCCTALGNATLGAVAMSYVPPVMQYTLQNWAWLKTRALPLTEPLQIANQSASNLTRLTIVLVALASIQALGILNLLMLLSRRGALALLPFVAHTAALLLGGVVLGAGFVLGPSACLASPLGCDGTRLMMLSALALVGLPFARVGFAARAAPRAFALYVLGLLAALCAFAVSAALSGEASERASHDVHARWRQIEPLLPADAFLCTGDRARLFAASAQGALSTFTALASAAQLLLLLLLLLTAYTRFDPRRRKAARANRHSAVGSANRATHFTDDS